MNVPITMGDEEEEKEWCGAIAAVQQEHNGNATYPGQKETPPKRGCLLVTFSKRKWLIAGRHGVKVPKHRVVNGHPH